MLTPPQHSKPPGTICHRVCFSKVFCMVKQRWSVMEALNPSVMSQTPPLLTLQVRWTHHAPGPSIQHNNRFKLLLNFYYFICLWIKCKEISVTLWMFCFCLVRIWPVTGSAEPGGGWFLYVSLPRRQLPLPGRRRRALPQSDLLHLPGLMMSAQNQKQNRNRPRDQMQHKWWVTTDNHITETKEKIFFTLRCK